MGIQVGASLVRGGYLSLGEALALLHSTPFRGVEVNQAHLTAFGDVEGFARRLSMFSLNLAGVYWGAKFHLREEHEFLLRDFETIRSRVARLNARSIVIGPPPRFRLFN
ncbi:MAG: hypothetical protein RXR39_05485, partial [Caldivirga sp.]